MPLSRTKVYNNVETFQNIRRHLPYDPKVWGNGKIIITTCDSNIGNNNYIPAKNIIKVEALTPDEKLHLFKSITNHNNTISEEQKIEISRFLEKIPPFPLDISVAAYYIKEEGISYNEYLEHLAQGEQDFISVQETILRDIGEYTKTRYEVVTLSIKRVLTANCDFADLLLFISFIDPDDIPKDLLVSYKGDVVVSRFMHELRKFSLINENHPNKFSIHRNTQKIALTYLTKTFSAEEYYKKLQEISKSLENYEENNLQLPNLAKSNLYITHAEAFLNNDKLLKEVKTAGLKAKLGNFYFYKANYPKAQELLEQAFIAYKNDYGLEHAKTALISTRLGTVYRNTGNYQKAKEYLKNALKIYKAHHGDDCTETAWVSVYLGSVYNNMGLYKEAKILLDQALSVYKQDSDKNNIKLAWVCAYLGNLYKNIGEYNKAKVLLKYALEVYQKYYDHENAQVAWVLTCLASVYKNTQEYIDAKNHLEEALTIYQKLYGSECIETAWVLSYLGSIHTAIGQPAEGKSLIEKAFKTYKIYYSNDHINIAWNRALLAEAERGLNNYTESEELLEKTYEVYKKFYGENHTKTALIFNSLGKIKLLKKDVIAAENLLKKSLYILEQHNHSKMYISLLYLADLYILKSQDTVQNKDVEQQKYFRTIAIDYYKRALKIMEIYLKEDNTKIIEVKSIIAKL